MSEIEDQQSIQGLSMRTLGSEFDTIDSSSKKYSPNKWKVSFVLITQKIRKYLSTGSNPFSFIYGLFAYLAIRFRVIFILIAVLIEVVTGYFTSIKKFIVKHMFWGRGGLFRFFMQIIGIVFVILVITLYTYRTPSTSVSYLGASDIANVYANQEDLIVQTGLTSTPVPDDRGRVQEEVYVVKGGDTVGKIAAFYDISIDTLKWTNDLTSAHFIKPGDSLIIPPGDGVVVAVEKGDTIETLAEEYNSVPQLILESNLFLAPPYELHAGDTLFLPDGRPPEPIVIAAAPVVSYTPYNPPSNNSTYTPSAGRFLNWPVIGGGKLTQCYSGWHNGIDIADRSMPDLGAAAGGTVTFAGCQSGSCPPSGVQVGGTGLAWTVMIDHGNGFSTVYGHMNQIYVRNGQAVTAGQAIGQMGQSGLAYGIHLHFMLIQGGGWKWVNPAPYMTTSVCGY